ncbi:MAG: LysR substrate-binding domain-containing protein [Chakrabartia sp.]
MTLWKLNLRHLRAVAEICARGSVNAAAQAVNLTQPAVTQGVARTEALIGQALFERSSDGMEPLESAHLFVPRILAAVDHIASARVTMAQVRALILFADQGSYAAASAASGLSQPSLHRAIGDLSVALRRSLLERRGKGLMLTEAGQRVVRGFRLARAELEAGLAELAGLQGRETGRIVIGAMPLSRARILPAAVAAFHARHPDVAVSIVEGSYSELAAPLREGDIDVMIGALREPSPGPDLVQQALFEDRPVIIGRAGHPLIPRLAAAEGEAATLTHMADFPWIVAAPGTPLRSQWERMFADANLAPPKVPIECGSVITIREILIKSDFLTLLSRDQLSVELEAGWVVQLGAAPSGILRRIGVTTRANWRPTKAQQAFVDELGRQSS